VADALGFPTEIALVRAFEVRVVVGVVGGEVETKINWEIET
jgi:hypothetical protein